MYDLQTMQIYDQKVHAYTTGFDRFPDFSHDCWKVAQNFSKNVPKSPFLIGSRNGGGMRIWGDKVSKPASKAKLSAAEKEDKIVYAKLCKLRSRVNMSKKIGDAAF